MEGGGAVWMDGGGARSRQKPAELQRLTPPHHHHQAHRNVCVYVRESSGGSIVVCGASCSANTAELPYSNTRRLGLEKEPVMWEVWIPNNKASCDRVCVCCVKANKTSAEQLLRHFSLSKKKKGALMPLKQDDHNRTNRNY